MKTPILTLSLFLTALQVSFAGGNTSIVEIDEVTSITIEEERILIVGTGMIRKRILSDKEHANDTVFGQPALWFHARAVDCEFEIIPYHLREDVSGVPGPDPSNLSPEEKAQSLDFWAGTIARAREIKVGDAVTIGYQREKMTITSVYVTHVVGSGGLNIRQGDKAP